MFSKKKTECRVCGYGGMRIRHSGGGISGDIPESR